MHRLIWKKDSFLLLIWEPSLVHLLDGIGISWLIGGNKLKYNLAGLSISLYFNSKFNNQILNDLMNINFYFPIYKQIISTKLLNI